MCYNKTNYQIDVCQIGKLEFKGKLIMTIEEIFSDLYDKYGEDFNWYMILLLTS